MNEEQFYKVNGETIALNDAYKNVSQEDLDKLKGIEKIISTHGVSSDEAREELRSIKDYMLGKKELTVKYKSSFSISDDTNSLGEGHLDLLLPKEDEPIAEFLKCCKDLLNKNYTVKSGTYELEVDSLQSDYTVEEKTENLGPELGDIRFISKTVLDLLPVKTTRSKDVSIIAKRNSLSLLDQDGECALSSLDIYIPYLCRIFPINDDIGGKD